MKSVIMCGIKTKINFIESLIFMIFVISIIKPNDAGVYCEMNNYVEQLTQVGGKYINSTGVVRALVLYIQFSDDNLVDNNPWSLGELPQYPFGLDFISSDVDATGDSYRNYSLSDYFFEMSSGLYHVIGEVYPVLVIPPHSQQWYEDNNYNYGEINYEILESLDPVIDYSLYDNWENNGAYNNINNPDGKVDMIFMIYRFIDEQIAPNSFGLQSNIAVLGPSGTDNLQTNDGVDIILDYFPGSGVTIQGGYLGEYLQYSIGISAHEYGHYLFGSGHRGSLGGNGIMYGGPGWMGNLGMHSYERERLGYIYFTEVENSGIATISDYLTTGVAYRVPVPGQNNEYFTVENRQQISIYDRPYNSGLIISHIKSNNIDIECADGRWNWNLCEGNSTQDQSDDKIFKDSHNSLNGFDGLDWIYINNKRYKSESIWLCPNEPVELHGDEKDAFNLDYNTLFSPWSNPNSHSWFDNFTDILIELKQQTGNNLIVEFNLNAPPKTPSNFRITGRIGQKAKPRWTQNNEPDLAGYKLYRKLDGQSDFSLLATLPANSTSYTDHQVTIARFTPAQAYYYVTAFDNNQNESENSPHKWVSYNPFKTILDESIFPAQFSLNEAFPNPFNPVTRIKFGLPEKSHIQLVVYDLLGREIVTLKSGIAVAGWHSIQWGGYNNHGTKVPSGIYIYTLTAESLESDKTFVETKKIVLLK